MSERSVSKLPPEYQLATEITVDEAEVGQWIAKYGLVIWGTDPAKIWVGRPQLLDLYDDSFNRYRGTLVCAISRELLFNKDEPALDSVARHL